MKKSKLVLSNKILNKYQASTKHQIFSLDQREIIKALYTHTKPPSLMGLVLKTFLSEIELVVRCPAGMIMRNNFCDDRPDHQLGCPGASASGEAKFLCVFTDCPQSSPFSGQLQRCPGARVKTPLYSISIIGLREIMTGPALYYQEQYFCIY